MNIRSLENHFDDQMMFIEDQKKTSRLLYV